MTYKLGRQTGKVDVFELPEDKQREKSIKWLKADRKARNNNANDRIKAGQDLGDNRASN